MPTITFHTNNQGAAIGEDPTLIGHTGGSGLGFFGSAFGISVPVGQWQSTTYVTNSDGTTSGIQAANTKYDTSVTNGAESGVYLGVTQIGNSGIPNYQTPLNIRFQHDEGVRVQNCRLRIFDRNNIENHADGVTTKVVEVRHPNPIQDPTGAEAFTFRGIEDFAWVTYMDGDPMEDMVLTPGPGPSGLNTSAVDIANIPEIGTGGYRNWIAGSGSACRATRHDWFLALSASPDEIGSKTDYGLYFTLEYL